MPDAARLYRPRRTTAKTTAPSRPSSAARLYDHRWRAARLPFLAEHPLCVMCQAEGLIVEATEVDHVEPHKGDAELFWDESNWQSLCKPCHSRKTASEDGGFGREVKK